MTTQEAIDGLNDLLKDKWAAPSGYLKDLINTAIQSLQEKLDREKGDQK